MGEKTTQEKLQDEIARLTAINAELLSACEQALEDYHGREPPTHLIDALQGSQRNDQNF